MIIGGGWVCIGLGCRDCWGDWLWGWSFSFSVVVVIIVGNVSEWCYGFVEWWGKLWYFGLLVGLLLGLVERMNLVLG